MCICVWWKSPLMSVSGPVDQHSHKTVQLCNNSRNEDQYAGCRRVSFLLISSWAGGQYVGVDPNADTSRTVFNKQICKITRPGNVAGGLTWRHWNRVRLDAEWAEQLLWKRWILRRVGGCREGRRVSIREECDRLRLQPYVSRNPRVTGRWEQWEA